METEELSRPVGRPFGTRNQNFLDAILEIQVLETIATAYLETVLATSVIKRAQFTYPSLRNRHYAFKLYNGVVYCTRFK